MKTKYEFSVRGYELDSFGHVNNSVYLNYMEESRWQVMNNVEEFYTYASDKGLFLAVIETNIKYIRELTAFSEAYIITDWSYEGEYVIAHHKVYNKANNRVSAKATVKMLLLSRERIIYNLTDSIKNVLSAD